MTLTARLSGQATPAQTSGVISDTRGGNLTARFSGIEPGQLPVYVALGDSGGEPGTYADFNSDIGGTVPPSEGGATYAYNVGSDTYDLVVTLPVPAVEVTLGQTLYAALFVNKTDVPGPTDVPDATAGPISVVA